MAVLLVFGVGERAAAIFASFGDTPDERRQVLERVLVEANARRLAEVDAHYRRRSRRGGGGS